MKVALKKQSNKNSFKTKLRYYGVETLLTSCKKWKKMLIFSKHFHEMLKIRGIQREWVEQTINYPDLVEQYDNDATVHYLKKISANENQ